MLTFDYSKAMNVIKNHEMLYMKQYVKTAHDMLHSKTGPGSEYTDWVGLPYEYDKEEFQRIKTAASKIQSDCDVFIVIGVGGSYAGARACIEMLSHYFYNILHDSKRKLPQIFFAGHNMSAKYMVELLEALEGKDVCINVISKSGTTTEPAIAFRILKKHIENKYGKSKAKSRIYVTTDKEKGALKQLADSEGYETFVIPRGVGGRYSVLTAVGLLPIAVSGADIDDIMRGAKDAADLYSVSELEKNSAYQYAAIRNLLYKKGYAIEILVSYEPSLQMFLEWWKQLFGESEGKDKKGIYPASAVFSTDLHSLGQYIQEGKPNLFETVIFVKDTGKDIAIEPEEIDIDGLNYLAGKHISFVNEKAFEGTLSAHSESGVPNLVINVPKLDEYYFGQLVYFFEKACAVSAYLLGVNPFDQPGVEAYKKKMFELLGKT